LGPAPSGGASTSIGAKALALRALLGSPNNQFRSVSKIAQTCGISKAAISKALLNLGAEYATFDEVEKERKALEVASTVGDRVYHEAHFHHQLAHVAPQPMSSPYNSPV